MESRKLNTRFFICSFEDLKTTRKLSKLSLNTFLSYKYYVTKEEALELLYEAIGMKVPTKKKAKAKKARMVKKPDYVIVEQNGGEWESWVTFKIVHKLYLVKLPDPE